MHFVVCMPVASYLMRSMRLILFLPESDVVDGVQQGLALSIGVCVLLSVVGALLSSFVVATVMGAPLSAEKVVRQRDRDAPHSMEQTATNYNNLTAACRAFDRVSDGHLSSGAVDVLSSITTTDVDCFAVDETAILVAELDGSANMPAVEATVTQHGGETVSLDEDTNVLLVALFRHQDDVIVRGILCGLALLQGKGAFRCAVNSGLLRRTGEDLSATTQPIQHALQLLASGAAGRVVVPAALLDGYASSVFVCAAQLSAARLFEVDSVAPAAWHYLPRRVRFVTGPGVPLQTLLRTFSGSVDVADDPFQR